MEADACSSAPPEWRRQSIDQVCMRVTSGGTPSRRRPEFYDGGGNGWVKSKELLDRWIDDTEEQITEEAVKSSSAKVLPENTLLLALYGATVGQLGILRRSMTCNQACCAIIVDSRLADFRYLFYQLLHHRRQLRGLASGAAQQNLSGQLIRGFVLPFPPLPEQQAITRILGALDDKIELNRRMNATLEALARAIFKSWFVDFDPVRAKLDGRQPAGMSADLAALFPDSLEHVDGELVPKGWKPQTLEELTTHIGSGATPRGGSKVYVDDGVALVRSQNVFDHKFVWDGLARITDKAADSLVSVALEEDDILFNITGASVLRTCIVDPDVLPARVNQHVLRIRAAPGISPRYLHLHLASQEMKDHLIGFNAGATREAVTKGHLQAVRIQSPNQEVMDAFSDLVRPIYSRIQANLRESRTLTCTRDTLLPKLLSGELRVGDAERAVGEVV
ncbi:EcoKI restriction-modification system protein HsdS [Posidoniimonas polymericola]|uniref:EcoKI restriction-modification system protein HsdS n=1 Tax=Posidoniimonas polymericola TaxID=2528002 RepID=A0A5C5XXT2_9BACT|nr:restriction endonuclease subunit S [Posidoniimonas polymericola]TWT66715.1 EcoKI restriction-modification system protein HsdS [Posidoniimonas polymericola]